MEFILGGKRGPTLTRFFESGCYKGAMAALKPYIATQRIDPVLYRIYLPSDIDARKIVDEK